MTNFNFIKNIHMLYIEFAFSLLLLFIGSQLLVNASIIISNKLQVNRLIIGLTIVSLATSLPELFVTIQATSQGYYGYALGNIIGSNISNISLVLGVTALISPVLISKKEIYLNYYPLIIISAVFTISILYLKTISITYGAIALISLISFNIFLFKKAKESSHNELIKSDDLFNFLGYKFSIQNTFFLFIVLFIGSLVLWLGSKLLIGSSTEIARIIGVSDRVIAISLVALGTSLPELFASAYAAFKNETKLAIGNLLGSNIFNILAVVGTTSLLNSINIESNLNSDTIIMFLMTLILFPLFYIRKTIVKNKNKLMIHKYEGIVLITIYIIYIISIF
ncbi:MAG: hypothetical protein CMD26_05485 [Flavobacteriales bacterium]|nr:hypothetical protein [Flavobacteriales bacterium]|tara:strand:- start:3964 stop:4974 length:1011 start_codon:yes stop_codon:yes gene_type:complete